MGIKKITGDGKVVLKLWRQRMELLGYKFITITNDNYMYKKKLPPSYISSCHYEDYEKIIKRRGHYWDNLKNMKKNKQTSERKFCGYLFEVFKKP